MSDKNLFGGGNANSLYNPMSETEQEAVHRLIEQEALELHILEWGYFEKPKIKVGDLRISIPIRLTFNAPDIHIPVYYFDLELRHRDGTVLFKKRESIMYNGEPQMLGSGICIEMVWDIAIQEIDPKFIKRVMPSARGLTSRVGNMKMDGETQKTYDKMRKAEAKVRQHSADKAVEATLKADPTAKIIS